MGIQFIFFRLMLWKASYFLKAVGNAFTKDLCFDVSFIVVWWLVAYHKALHNTMKYYTQKLDIYQNSCSDKQSAFKIIFIHFSFRWYKNDYFRNVCSKMNPNAVCKMQQLPLVFKHYPLDTLTNQSLHRNDPMPLLV